MPVKIQIISGTFIWGSNGMKCFPTGRQINDLRKNFANAFLSKFPSQLDDIITKSKTFGAANWVSHKLKLRDFKKRFGIKTFFFSYIKSFKLTSH